MLWHVGWFIRRATPGGLLLSLQLTGDARANVIWIFDDRIEREPWAALSEVVQNPENWPRFYWPIGFKLDFENKVRESLDWGRQKIEVSLESGQILCVFVRTEDGWSVGARCKTNNSPALNQFGRWVKSIYSII